MSKNKTEREYARPLQSSLRMIQNDEDAAETARRLDAYPEMLKALRAAWPGLSGDPYERPITEVWELARAALAKADGRE